MRGRFHSIKRDAKKLSEKWREKDEMVSWHLDCAIAEVEKAKERAVKHDASEAEDNRLCAG